MGIRTKVFRPPYGRITKQQRKSLLAANFKIIMWDILTYDYDKHISIEPCLAKIIDKSRNGSIVVFHDSEKALPQLKQLLLPYIIAMKAKGFQFKVII
jgi:peptidoglycan/xylan/chitin deacetylase (PgdA/CDA1 family)